MTHWPTPVSSLNTALVQNESSNPTSDGSQLRSSHNIKAALRSPSLCINTALLLGVMPTQVVHVLLDVVVVVVVLVDGVA